MSIDPSTLVATRRALHGVAELVLAGPQYAACGSIELRVTAGGFGTVDRPDLRVAGAQVLADGRAERIDGHTPRSLAAALGVEVTRLDDVYSGGPGVSEDELLVVDEASAQVLAEAFAAGDTALRSLAPDASPVLWPEHFDIGVTVDEVNYGVSPGDDHVPVPYAYVGPWTMPARDQFWNQSFGAAREMATFADPTAVHAFFEEGRDRLRGQSAGSH
jgi:hypothetical protein